MNVGKWIRMLYDVIMQGLAENRWYYDKRLADNALNFIERFCHHYTSHKQRNGRPPAEDDD